MSRAFTETKLSDWRHTSSGPELVVFSHESGRRALNQIVQVWPRGDAPHQIWANDSPLTASAPQLEGLPPEERGWPSLSDERSDDERLVEEHARSRRVEPLAVY